jgi:hypothetical protein
MTAHFTLVTVSEDLRRLVAEFARGLGCAPESAPGGGAVRAAIPDVADTLLSLLTYVALSAIKLLIDLAEPLCEVTYRHGAEASEVTLSLRLADIRLQKPVSV